MELDKQKYIDKLNTILENTDTEMAHFEADDVLVSILLELGYQEITDVYNKINKWYS